MGVAFCGPCARKQEAYFAIGELTHEEARDLHSKPLAEVLERMQRGRTGSTEGIAAEMRHELSGVDKSSLSRSKSNSARSSPSS